MTARRKLKRSPRSTEAIIRRPERYFVDLARDFYSKHGRPPSSSDFTVQIRKTINRRFGSWEEFILKALRMQHTHRNLTEERLLDYLRTWYGESKEFLTWAKIEKLDRSVATVLHRRFSSLSAAYEKAVGNSPRLEILRALERLTPPGCEVATIAEINSAIAKRGLMLGQSKISHTLEHMAHERMVHRGRGDIISVWKLAPAGRKLLREYSSAA